MSAELHNESERSERMYALAQMPPAELAGRADELSELSPEQRATVLGASAARHFIKLPEVAEAVAAMITARRMYAIGWVELMRVLAARAEAGESVPELTADTLVQSTGRLAAKPFSEEVFMNGLVQEAMPAIARIIDRHIEADESRAAAEQREKVSRPIPLPARIDADDELPVLTRDWSLTLSGDSRGCRLVLDRILRHVGRQPRPFCVLWLDDRDRPEDSDADPYFLRVGPDVWAGSANSSKMRFFSKSGVSPFAALVAPVDLVVCSDLSRLVTSGYAGRHKMALAGDGHRRLWSWCRAMNAALLGFVPSVEPDGVDSRADISCPASEQLRTFSRLRGVNTVWGDGGVRLLVGNAGYEIKTTVQELDSFSRVLRCSDVER